MGGWKKVLGAPQSDGSQPCTYYLGQHGRTRRRGGQGGLAGQTVRCSMLLLITNNANKRRTAMNLILAFAVSLKHKLRFEPDVGYEDLAGLVAHLDTFAKEAHDRQVVQPPKKTPWKSVGEYLGVSFAESNPRKLIKRSKKPLGHLPLEILNHLSAYVDRCIANNTLNISLHQGQASTYPSRCLSNISLTSQSPLYLPLTRSSPAPSASWTLLFPPHTVFPSPRLPGSTSSCCPSSCTTFSNG